MEKKETYREEQKTALTGLLLEVPGFILLLVTAIQSGTMLVWLDFVDSLCYCLQTGFVVYISFQLRKNLKYKYNYGIVRVENGVSLFCDLLMVMGTVCIAVIAVYDLFEPERPGDVLLYVVLFKIIEIVIDLFLVVKHARIRKKSHSAIVDTEYSGAVKDLVFDGGSFLLIGICYVFREQRFSWYFSSAAAIGCCVGFIIGRIRNMKAKVRELCDETLDEEVQFKVLNCLNRHNSSYSALYSINSHKLDSVCYIDFHLGFPDGTTFEKITELREQLGRELQEVLGDCRVAIVIEETKLNCLEETD